MMAKIPLHSLGMPSYRLPTEPWTPHGEALYEMETIWTLDKQFALCCYDKIIIFTDLIAQIDENKVAILKYNVFSSTAKIISIHVPNFDVYNL